MNDILTTTEPKYLTINFKLPNHANELSKADDIIEKLKIKLRKMVTTNTINGEVHTVLFEEIVRVLDYVGRLSIPLFDIEEEFEAMYVLQYAHSPELGKRLFYDHYDKLHHPYTLLKNRCYKLLEELDEFYIDVNKSNPPNWKD